MLAPLPASVPAGIGRAGRDLEEAECGVEGGKAAVGHLAHFPEIIARQMTASGNRPDPDGIFPDRGGK